MAETCECKRELIIDKSRDQVWEWLSDLRNVMTANQFHMEIDCDDATAANPRLGLEVPILHGLMESRIYRIARINRFDDYVIGWGERVPDDAGYEDPFPHSESWRVEDLGAQQCRVQTTLRGRYLGPVGQYIGQYVFDAAMSAILDNDLQDLALAVGAIPEKQEIKLSPGANAMLRLALAEKINDQPAGEFLAQPFGVPKMSS